MADLGGGHGAIVPGKPDESEAFRRLSSDDIEEKMPPPDSGLTLTPQQIELIREVDRAGGGVSAALVADPAVAAEHEAAGRST